MCQVRKLGNYHALYSNNRCTFPNLKTSIHTEHKLNTVSTLQSSYLLCLQKILLLFMFFVCMLFFLMIMYVLICLSLEDIYFVLFLYHCMYSVFPCFCHYNFNYGDETGSACINLWWLVDRKRILHDPRQLLTSMDFNALYSSSNSPSWITSDSKLQSPNIATVVARRPHVQSLLDDAYSTLLAGTQS